MLGIHSQITFFVGKKYVTHINYAKSIFNIITVNFRIDFADFKIFIMSLLIANAPA